MPNLSAGEQKDTIFSSKEALEALTGRPVTHFAYPLAGVTASMTTRWTPFARAGSRRPARLCRGTSNPIRIRISFRVAWL